MSTSLDNKGYAADITAPWYLLWGMLVEKIKHPDKFLPAKNVKIEGEGPGYVDRYMEVGDRVFRERITWDEATGTVKFAARDGADLTVWNVLKASEGQEGVYNLRFFDTNLDGSADPPKDLAVPTDKFKGAVDGMKAQAEKISKASVPIPAMIKDTHQIGFLCLVDLAPGKTVSDLHSNLKAHLEYLKDLETKGTVEQHGPMLNYAGANTGKGAYMIRTSIPLEADRVAREDPLARAGIRTFQLLPWAKTSPKVPSLP